MSNKGLIFPGQGAQYPSMGKDFFDQFAIVRDVFEEASDILSLSIKKLIFDSDEKTLSQTKNSQVAIFVVCSAICKLLFDQFICVNPSFCAGLSLGEYTALFASQKISFQDCLSLVYSRGLFMEDAAVKNPGGMIVVSGVSEEELQSLGYLVANVNCPNQIVISCSQADMEKVFVKLREAGGSKLLRINVSGPFHSPFMESAAVRLKPLIDDVEICEGCADIVMNVTGSVEKDKNSIRENLIRQVTSTTRWMDCMKAMIAHGVDEFLEIGPTQLTSINRRIDERAKTIKLSTVEDLDHVYGAFKE